MVIDISNFYLNTPLPPTEREYMWIEEWMIPQDILEEYDVEIVNGRALVEITNAMYGLPQAGRLAYNKLKKHLADDGYHPCKLTPGLFRHSTRPISFCLVVDDFGIKYVGTENAEHLIATLKNIMILPSIGKEKHSAESTSNGITSIIMSISQCPIMSTKH